MRQVYLGVLGLAVGGVLCPLSGQSLGNYQAEEVSGKLEITQGVRRWVIREASLPVRYSDCQTKCFEEAGTCHGRCVWSAGVMTIDEKRQIAYLSAITGTWLNNPWIVFRYSLATREVRRLASDFGAWIKSFELSPGGRYLAYVFSPHISAMCPTTSWLGVIDTKLARSAKLEAPGKFDYDFTAVHWKDPMVIDFERDLLYPNACNDEAAREKAQHERGRIDVRELEFK